MEDGIDIGQLLKLRKLTRAVADHLTRQLNAHLGTLGPLLNPRTLFGDNVSGGARVPGKSAEQAYQALVSAYQTIHHTKPFNLRSKFDTPISLLSASLEIEPASYEHAASHDGENKTVTVTRPLTWVLSFEGFKPSRVRELLAGRGDVSGSKLQECVLHYLLLSITLQKKAGIRDLLQALRFPVTFEHSAEFGELPLVTISAPLSTARPPDKVIIESTEISGSPQFEEVVQSADLEKLADPLREKLATIFAG